jgi:hypothetical protein
MRTIHRLAEVSGMKVRTLERFNSFPMTARIPVLKHIEQWWINRIEAGWGAHFRSNLLGVLEFRKMSHPSPTLPFVQ